MNLKTKAQPFLRTAGKIAGLKQNFKPIVRRKVFFRRRISETEKLCLLTHKKVLSKKVEEISTIIP